MTKKSINVTFVVRSCGNTEEWAKQWADHSFWIHNKRPFGRCNICPWNDWAIFMTKYFKIQKVFYKWFTEPKFFPEKIGQKWQQSRFMAAILPTNRKNWQNTQSMPVKRPSLIPIWPIWRKLLSPLILRLQVSQCRCFPHGCFPHGCFPHFSQWIVIFKFSGF